VKRRIAALLAAASASALLAAAPARAESFGLHSLDFTSTAADGSPAMWAGSHPFAVNNEFEVNTEEIAGLGVVPAGQPKDVAVALPPGLVGDPGATPRCTTARFSEQVGYGGGATTLPGCSDSTAVGVAFVNGRKGGGDFAIDTPIYNLVPPPGVAARLGFWVVEVGPVTVDFDLNPDPPYNLIATSRNINQISRFYAAALHVWGNPASPAHDDDRGVCGATFSVIGEVSEDLGDFLGIHCPVKIPEAAFLTLPRSCTGPLTVAFEADSWQRPGEWVRQTVTTHDDSSPPQPLGLAGCERLSFSPQISAQPTNGSAAGPTGLDFDLSVADEGLADPGGLADSDIKRAEVTLPAGMTINPSQAEGLATCSEAELAREAADSRPGEGCPQAAKIGTVEVETPLLKGELLRGSLYVATPYENLASDSLIALYMVIRDPQRGIVLRLPGKVAPDPRTGRLTTTFGEAGNELPQLPFSRFHLHFREGGRSPLITPPACGAYETEATFYPWSGAPPYKTSSGFRIGSGPGGGPCPRGAAPFRPGFEAGTLGNQAGSYSPFLMRLTRGDGEQDMGRFSFVLPPGVVPRLAGIPYCPEAGIARAKSRTGEHGGTEEIDDPSCPAASRIGRTVAGAGVGGQLTYVPGALYLAGPYHGDPISAVSITPAVAGPFDAGTVVVREALRLNPVTHVGEVDGAASDPIPHILKGIPLNVRDLRVYADRPQFTLNATSCEPFAALATVWGEGTALAPAGETPVGLGSRYQAAGCASLGFRPKLGIKLKGGTKRGKFPALKAVVTPRAGDANFSSAVVTLPHSAFLEQGHFGTICTRVQFAAAGGNGAGCPPGSVYGRATAFTPLLDTPLQGPVYLRSSNHNLPDLVVALHGLVNIDLAARIDSVRGGIRSTFTGIPDAPVSRFILEMRGGKKGLIVNSTNLCAKPKSHRARAKLRGQNGKADRVRPVVRAVKCKKHKKHKKHHGHGGRR
jgi:hypothetical protein